MKRILLIDDDKDISELIQIVLGEQYEVACKTDHTGLTDTIKSFSPHLVLLDNSVRRQHGSDMVSEIKSSNDVNRVPVVLFSAHTDIEKIAMEVNADGYLAKPFNLVELYTCIDRLIA